MLRFYYFGEKDFYGHSNYRKINFAFRDLFFPLFGRTVCGYSTTKYSSVDHESNFRRNRYLFWNIYVTLQYNGTGKCYSKWLATDCRLKFKPKPPIILILVFPCLHIFSYLTVYINFNKKMIIIANIFTFFFIKIKYKCNISSTDRVGLSLQLSISEDNTCCWKS